MYIDHFTTQVCKRNLKVVRPGGRTIQGFKEHSITVFAFFVHDLQTVLIDNHRAVPMLGASLQSMGFETARSRIDEIAEVTQTTPPPPGSDHASVLGAHARESNVEGEFYH